MPFHRLAPGAGLGGLQRRTVPEAIRERPVGIDRGDRPQRQAEAVQRGLRKLEAPRARCQGGSVGGTVRRQGRRIAAFGRVDARTVRRVHRHGSKKRPVAQLGPEEAQHGAPRANPSECVLEGGVNLVEIQRFDHRPVTADFLVAQGDAPVETLVRGNPRGVLRQVEFDHVPGEQRAPVAQGQHGVPVEMAAGVEESDAWSECEALVVGMGGAERVRPRQVIPLDRHHLRGKPLLHLPETAVGVRVRSRQPPHAPARRDFGQGGFGVPRRILEQQVAAGQGDEVAAGTDAKGRCAAEGQHPVSVLVPGGGDPLRRFFRVPELEAVLRRSVPEILAHGATGRHREMPLPESAVGADEKGQAHGKNPGSALHRVGEQAHRVEVVFRRVGKGIART